MYIGVKISKASKANYPMASRPSHNPQLRERALNFHSHGLEPAAAYTPALQLGALNDVGGRPHLS